MRKLLILLLLLKTFSGFAQPLEFIENKGQWNEAVDYRATLNNGAVFLKKTGYRVLLHQPEAYINTLRHRSGHGFVASNQQIAQSNQSGVIPSHAYEMNFKESSSKAVPSSEKKMPGYNNFFIGNNPDKWVGDVGGFATVQYQSIYKGVDIRYYSDEGFLKYDLIAAPGAAVNQIVMVYEGLESISLSKGELVLRTSVGEVRERAPYTYQLVNGVRKTIPCSYLVSGNEVRFRLSGYDSQWPLIIDPTFVFSTFVGSLPDDWGYTATFDKQGNAYGGGIVFGNGYPASIGAFQTVFGGGTNTGESSTGFDISIIKLDPLGRTRIYSTYLGGNNNEQPHSLIVNANGELIVAGRTLSANYPLNGLGAVGQGGAWDIIVTRFNSTGTALLGSVKIGGTGDDGVNVTHKFPSPRPQFTDQNYGDDARSEVMVDEAGYIYVASCSRSTNFPVTSNAVQSALNGSQDGLLLKFNPTLTNLEFATYIGGSGFDAAYVLIVEPAGDILVAGGTTSNNFPGDKTGTIGTSFGGGLLDGFIARFSSDGGTLRKVMYAGTAGNDQVYGIQRDRNGFVYFMGTSTGNFPVRNAAFSQTRGKQFIAKIQPDFSAYVYSTVFGTDNPNPNISPTAFLVDKCENVYVSGWGGDIIPGANYPIAPTTGLRVTPDAIKSITDGRDFYFFVLEKDATTQLYGSFFGMQEASDLGSHDHVDGGTSRFDEDGIIYQGICASCNGGQFPTTPGTVSPTNPSSRCNLAIVKINFDLSGVRTGVQSFIEGTRRDSSTCVPAVIEFVDSIAIGKRFEWQFGDGSPDLSSDTPAVYHTFNRPGNYRVRLIAIDDTKCIPRDTSFMNIRVRIDRIAMSAAASPLPPCTDLNYQFDNNSIPFPGKPFRDSSFLWYFGDNSAPVRAGLQTVTHRFPAAGTYNIRLVLADTNYCNAPDSFAFPITISPNTEARFTSPLSGCVPFAVPFANSSIGGATFEWDFGNGQRSLLNNPTHTFTQPGQYQVRLISRDPNSCNVTDTSFAVISVNGPPVAGFNFSPNPPRENISTTFINQSGPASFYRWQFGDGDSLTTVRIDTVVRHQFPRTAIYNACLVAVNEFGCADTACLPISASVDPIIDVVSAFTPNGDGVNDRAIVFGFGVNSMVFRIYNRWGQLMFESNNPRNGWNGVFKGKPQPMDAYAFTLEAELIDGEKVKRAGSITLIR